MRTFFCGNGVKWGGLEKFSTLLRTLKQPWAYALPIASPRAAASTVRALRLFSVNGRLFTSVAVLHV